MTNTMVSLQLARLRNKYAKGLYWNHHPDLENDRYSVREEFDESGNLLLDPGTNNEFAGGSGCWAFVLHFAEIIFGSKPSGFAQYSNANGIDCGGGWKVYSGTYTQNISLEAGDIVRVGPENDGHSAMVLNVTSSKVTFAEAWGGHRGKLAWDTFNDGDYTTESQIKAAATYIIKAPKTTSTLQALVTFDKNDNGTSSETTTAYHYNESCYSAFPSFTRSGYTFMGWWPERNTNSEEYAIEMPVPDYAHTLYAHWGLNYVVQNVAAERNLSFDLVDSTAGNGAQLMLAQGSNPTLASQRWTTESFTNTRVLKTLSNIDFGISYRNGAAKLMRTFKNENNTSENTYSLIQYESIDSNIYKIRLSKKIGGQYLYLTANSTASGATCSWTTSTNSDLQRWKFIRYSI